MRILTFTLNKCYNKKKNRQVVILKNIYDFLVVGAGASGLVCAIEHNNRFPEDSVAIIEKLSRVGKKILATGNGRCNLTNLDACKNDYNHPDFVSAAFEEFPVKSNIEFFEKIGLLTYSDSENRVYPYSNNASSVLNVLRNECAKLKIDFFTDMAVENVEYDNLFKINNFIRCKKLVVATGGKSSSVHGSDGSGYKILEHFSHKIIKPVPSLVQLCTNNNVTKQLKGIRLKGALCLMNSNEIIGQSEGEILFTDYGLSGIATLDLSYFVSKQKDVSKLSIEIDMAKDYSEDYLFSFIKSRIEHNPENTANNLLSFILPQKASEVFVKECKIEFSRKFALIKENEINKLVNILKHFTLEIVRTKGFDMSQVTCGGADVNEFDKNTLESKKVKNLFCCGEILDIDSKCGGFNLQWAWSSGRLAGLCKESNI